MDMAKDILAKALQSDELRVSFPDLPLDAKELLEGACFRCIQSIKAILSDDSLDDKDCFLRIEEIVSELESLGCGGGGRHDFG